MNRALGHDCRIYRSLNDNVIIIRDGESLQLRVRCRTMALSDPLRRG